MNDNFAGIHQTLSGGAMHVAAVVHDERRKGRGSPGPRRARFASIRRTISTLTSSTPWLARSCTSAATTRSSGSGSSLDATPYGTAAGRTSIRRETNDMLLSPDMILAGMGLAPSAADPAPAFAVRFRRSMMVSTINCYTWLTRARPSGSKGNTGWTAFRTVPAAGCGLSPAGWHHPDEVDMLNDYERVKNSDVYVAREIHMEWPEQGDTFTMHLGTPDFKDVPPGAFEMNKTQNPRLPRDRWIAVGKQTRSARPAAIEPAATYPASSAASEPIMTQPDAPAPAMEPESSPE